MLRSEFALQTPRPYVVIGSDGLYTVDYCKPFVFPASIKNTTDCKLQGGAVWSNDKISCADDICMLAHRIPYDMEVIASGMQLTVKEALFEAARTLEAERCKYIVFEHPILQKKYGKPAIVLENTAAPPTSQDVMVVSLVSQRPHPLA
jgi:hypothetical protein